MMNKRKIMVSVLSLSYNQKHYIKQCLDSILGQKTNFRFEVLINDDASTDGTAEIIKEYQTKHPQIIKPVFQKENKYSKGERNMIVRYLLPKVKGKYLAICEGDDFWTDLTKLQKQVDFMEAHPDYALCFHPVKVFYEKGEIAEYIYPNIKKGFTLNKLITENYIPTNSVMYRSQADYSACPVDVMPADWYLHMFHAQFGRLKFFNKVMSAYRKHEEGVWWATQDNPYRVWNDYGLYFLALDKVANDMFGDDSKYKKAVYKRVYNDINQLIVSKPSGGQGRTQEAIKKYPGLIDIYLTYNQEQISYLEDRVKALGANIAVYAQENDKKSKIIDERIATEQDLIGRLHQVEAQLKEIKGSRTWRARTKVVDFLTNGENK
ncbi:MAG: glycosyltransferase [Candidatus Nomurabacteria bacterium]|nr:MAG: glycosyltransferase [Candidatus Nomurabacteria bacterium]